MKLKRSYAKQDEIPKEAVGLYTETGDGKWVLDAEIEGLAPTTRVDEFRTSNVQLKAKAEGLEEKLKAYKDKEHGGDRTPEAVDELWEKRGEIEDGKLTKTSDVQKRVDERVAEMKKDFEKKLAEKDAKLADKDVKLQRAVIESKALEAGAQFGLRKSATEDLVDRVLKVFKIDEKGDAVAYQDDGKTVRYGADDKPLQIKDFVKRLATDTESGAPHLFEPNEGGGGESGTRASRDGVDGGEPNPWMKEHFNRQKQGEIIMKDPDKAERMSKKAGAPIKIGEATRSAARQNVGARR